MKRIFMFLGISGIFLVLLGQACGQFRTLELKSMSSLSSVGVGEELVKDVVPLKNVKTAAVLQGSQILESMISCTGLEHPSSVTQLMWEEKKSSISEEGTSNSVTAPMLVAVVSIAGEVCHDLIEKEKSTTNDRRKFFPGLDLDRGSQVNQSSRVDFTEVVRKFARSCWQRNETSTELDLILDAMFDVEDLELSENGDRARALFVCTSMLSSLSALEN